MITPLMEKRFRDALLWHLEHHQTPIVDLARGSGVSRDQINKLRAREGATTSAEDAMRIAAYYGKSLEQFMRCDPSANELRLDDLKAHLTDDERKTVEALMRTLLASRGLE